MLFSLNVSSAVVGLVQTLLIAWLYGSTRSVEIFFAATTFQMMFVKLSASGSMGALFTPIYHSILTNHGHDEARAAFSAMTNVMVISALVLAAIAITFAEQISAALVPGFSAEDLALTAKAFVAVAPLIVVAMINSMGSNLLRAEHKYGVTASLNLVSRILNIAVLIAFARAFGIWALILGVWASSITMLLGQLWFLHQTGRCFSLRLGTKYFTPRSVLSKIPLTFSHLLSAQFFTFALTASLSVLPAGTFAAYSYAQRLYSKIQGFILEPIGIVFFNHFSQKLAQQIASVRALAEHALSLTAAATTLCFVPVFSGGDLLLSGLWGGENFPPDHIEQSHYVLAVLTALLVVDAQYLVARRTNFSLQYVGHQYLSSGIVLIISAALCYWLIPKYGLVGVVVVHTFSSIAKAAVSLAVLASVRRDLVCIAPWDKLGRWVLAAIMSISFAWMIRGFMPIADAQTSASKLAIGMVVASSGLISVYLLSLAMKIPESQELLAKIRDKLLPIVNHG